MIKGVSEIPLEETTRGLRNQKDSRSNCCFIFCNPIEVIFFFTARVLTLSFTFLIYKMRIITLKHI